MMPNRPADADQTRNDDPTVDQPGHAPPPPAETPASKTPPAETTVVNESADPATVRAEPDATFLEPASTGPAANEPTSPPGLTVDDGQTMTQPDVPGGRQHHGAQDSTVLSPDLTRKEAAPTDKRHRALPNRVSRYETISLLGEGSFGWVLKSHDPNLDRTVAVKIQKVAALGSSQVVDRFLREARSAAQLRHPNIVPVFEYGKFADNHFIVYQFIDGKTIKSWVAEDHPTLEQKVTMIAQMSEALDYAHASGIVHRDIKPANILVDARQQPHIADFGCARREQGEVTRTIEGSLMGTPAYMSPEAAAGQAHAADGRSDIWSVGVMLYELVAGQRPFRGKLTEIFHAIQHAPAKSLRQLDRSVPIELDTICDKCLQKSPDQRFQTAGELAADLRRWLQGLPIESRRTSVWRRTWMWAKRNRAVASLLGVVAAILVAISIVSVVVSFYFRDKNREIAGFSAALVENQGRLIASHVNSLVSAQPGSLPIIVDGLVTLDAEAASLKLRDELDVLQRRTQTSADSTDQDRTQARYELALYLAQKAQGQSETSLVEDIVRYLPRAEPGELEALVEILKNDREFRSRAGTFLTQVAADNGAAGPQRLRAYCTLANIGADQLDWSLPSVRQPVIGNLMAEPPQNRFVLANMLIPVKSQFAADLTEIYEKQDEAYRIESQRAAEILSVMFAADVEYLCQLGMQAAPFQLKPLCDAFSPRQKNQARDFLHQKREQFASPSLPAGDEIETKTNVRLMLALLGDADAFDQSLEFHKDPTERTKLIHDAALANVRTDPFRRTLELAVQEWSASQNQPVKSVSEHRLMACIAALGEYGLHQLDSSARDTIKNQLLQLFAAHPSGGVHSMSRWLLTKWDYQDDVQTAIDALRLHEPRPGFAWHEDKNSGLCFSLFGPVEFVMGQPGNSGPQADTTKSLERAERIPYRIGISTREISRGVFAEWYREWMQDLRQQVAAADGTTQKDLARALEYFENRWTEINTLTPESADLPMANVNWYAAARFCNGLSQRAEIDPKLMAYRHENFLENWSVSTNDGPDGSSIHQPSYRLPTAIEWEYASRAGTVTQFSFGRNPKQMISFGWNIEHSITHPQPVGQLKPNDLGMFDMHGNVNEWCHNTFDQLNAFRELRDQHFSEAPRDMSVFGRTKMNSRLRHPNRGLRVARIYPVEP